MENLRERNRNSETKVTSLEKEVKSLMEQLETVNNLSDGILQNDFTNLQNRNNDLHKQLAESQAERGKLNKNIEKLKADAETLEKKLNNRVNSLEIDNTKLRSGKNVVDKMLRKKDDVESELKNKQEQLKGTCETLKNENRKLSATVMRVQQEDESINLLNEKYQQQSLVVENLKNENSDLRQLCENLNLEKNLLEKSDRSNELLNNSQLGCKACVTFEAQVAELTVDKNNLSLKCKQLSSEIDQLNSSLSTFEETNKTLQKNSTSVENERKRYSALLLKHDDLTNKHRILNEQNNELTKKHRILNDQYDDLTTEHRTLNEQHDQLTNNYRTLNVKHDELTTQHQTLNNQHDQLTSKYQGLSDQHSLVKEKLAIIENEKSEFLKMRKTTVDECQDLRNELDKYKENNNKLKYMLHECSASNSNIEAQNAESQGMYPSHCYLSMVRSY